MSVRHAFMHMGISSGHFGVRMAQLFLNYAQVFGLAVKIRAATMAEDMAGVAVMFEVAATENAVHDVANAVTADPAEVMAMVGNDGGGEGAIFGRAGTGCEIPFQNSESGIAGVNHSPMAFTANVDGAVFPVNIFIAEAVDFDVTKTFHAHEVDD